MSDKTFSETQGHAPFDWNKWLDQAILNEPPDEEYEMARSKAEDWTTCATGNQCAIIPRLKDNLNIWGPGTPKDVQLRDLGISFMTSVQLKEWGSSKYTLLQIEQRSAVLIAEELQKLNQK